MENTAHFRGQLWGTCLIDSSSCSTGSTCSSLTIQLMQKLISNVTCELGPIPCIHCYTCVHCDCDDKWIPSVCLCSVSGCLSPPFQRLRHSSQMMRRRLCLQHVRCLFFVSGQCVIIVRDPYLCCIDISANVVMKEQHLCFQVICTWFVWPLSEQFHDSTIRDEGVILIHSQEWY